METDTSGWSLEGDYERSDEEANSGTYSIKQTSTGDFANLLTESAGIKLEPGKRYNLSLYSMLEITSGSAPKLRLTYIDPYGDIGTNGGQTLFEIEVPESEDFANTSIDFTAPDDIVWIRIFNNNGTVTAYYDDFAISPVERNDLNTLKKLFYINQAGGNFTDSVETLEKNFYRYKIVGAGKTPVGNYLSDLLKQTLSALTLPVSKFLNVNYRTLYQNL